MQSSDTNQSIDSDDIQLSNIIPRLCILYKWPHYDGYGILLNRNKHPLGLRIDSIEPNSPAESGGLLSEDIVLAVNGHSTGNDDFYVILSCIEYALEQDRIRFLVLDSKSAEFVQRYQINIDENNENCIRIEASQFIETPTQLLHNQPQTEIQNVSCNTFDDIEKLPSDDMDADTCCESELRMCTVTLQPNIDSIGITLEPDTDFGHIIRDVESYSPAARAGIQRNDHIIAVNDTSLLHLPFEDVLYFLKKKRHDKVLNFLIAKKAYLIQTLQTNLISNLDSELNSPLNTLERTKSSTLPITQAVEHIHRTSGNEQSEQNQQRETILTITDEQYDRLSLQIYTNRYTAKHRKKHGNVHKGVGAATALRFSWSLKSEKTLDYASINADLDGGRKPVLNEEKKENNSLQTPFNFLQVGMTNPSPTQQTRRILTSVSTFNSSGDDSPKIQGLSSSFKQHNNLKKQVHSPKLTIRNNNTVTNHSLSAKHNQTIQNILNPTTVQSLSTWPIYEQDNSRFSQSNLHLNFSSTTSDIYDDAEQIHSVVTDTSQNINNKLEDDKNEELYFKPIEIPISTENISNDIEKKLNHSIEHDKSESIKSKSSDSDLEIVNSEYTKVKIQVEEEYIVDTFHISNTNEIEENSNESFPNEDNQSISNISTNSADEGEKPENDLVTSKPSIDMTLVTTPISELPDYGYELHNIKLMQPTETVPLGFKLSKQTDSLQCVISAIDHQSKADIAGLHMDDWLIKIEDVDIRLNEFSDVSQKIYETLNTVGSINVLIARNKSTRLSTIFDDPRASAIAAYDKPNELNFLLSVGLSNKIEEHKDPNQSKQNDDTDDKIRHIILKEALGLDFYSFTPDKNSQIIIHSINNVRPLSTAHKAGLRNGDRILTVNNIDITKINHKNVRHRLVKKSPVHLTVTNDPKYLELIENIKRDQNRIMLPSLSSSSSSSNYEPIERQSSNLLSEDLINVLFIDDTGPIYMKHCVFKQESINNSVGFTLHYKNNFHIIDNVEIDMPAYNCGLRNDDVILYVNKHNVEQMPHDNVRMLVQTLILSNESFNLILLNINDMQRYKNYQEKSFIDWQSILSEINEDDINQGQQQQQNSDFNNLLYKPNEALSSCILPGTRICILKPLIGRSAGFSISGEEQPPFVITNIDKDSPAEEAGLQLNDTILSINKKPLIHTNYNDTIQIIKQALQQKIVQIVVNQQPISNIEEKHNSQLLLRGNSNNAVGITTDNTKEEEPTHHRVNALEVYQRQRNQELTYSLRLCHLNTTNSDGQPASTFGFDISKEPKYEYPMISRVEPKLPGELAGLQSRDLLIKVNDRKTKGLDIDKVKRTIEKAKYNGRLELLVVDEQVYRYCMRTHKKFKEPYIKVKHIFPRSKSRKSVETLDSIAASTPITSQHMIGQSMMSTTYKVHQRSITKDDFISSTSEETIDVDTTLSMNPSQQKNISSTNQRKSSGFNGKQNQMLTDKSKVNSVSNTINNLFQFIGYDKSNKLDYDIPTAQTSVPPNDFIRNFSEEMQHMSRLYHTVRSNRSSGLYDYIRDPRRCLLKIDPNKGLGFVLSATGDYDHTITAVEKNSTAEVAGLLVNDELVEIDSVDVRNITYEQVVQMLFSAIKTQDTIEMCVTNNHMNDIFASTNDTHKSGNILVNNIDNNSITTTHTQGVFNKDLSSRNSPDSSFKQQIINKNSSDLPDQEKQSNNIIDYGINGNIPAYSTGITASPKLFRSKTSSSITSKNTDAKLSQIPKNDAPVARLCHIRRLPSSPFCGFFLTGNPKRLGRVHVSNIKKNSSAALCGLRNGDRIIEVNGTDIQTLTYETILNKIQLHMERHDLELLVLDKKSLRWYQDRKYPVTSQTLPTIVRIEPVINNINVGTHTSNNNIRNSNFFDRQESTTKL
ncbi:unnamed protein product [Adineta steineri]|uniref:PDZ domain-containing protein n=1 Tax=Adineta steineri TaxID=433720 RepID=A0A814B6T9_9BILA|nr:unnamed protein product [Adineta steineri]CAF3531897.1 unnamed protein product [Adineta steineri]